MKIEILNTPNPATLKFQLPMKITEEPIEFLDVSSAFESPIATKLFGFPWTQSVFLGSDFVSVTKQDWVDWSVLAEPLSDLISEHFDRGELAVEKQSSKDSQKAHHHHHEHEDSPEARQIIEILERDIRPVLAMDGGDIAFVAYKNGILKVQLKGACSGCPSSQATLRDGIEARLQELIPTLRAVISI